MTLWEMQRSYKNIVRENERKARRLRVVAYVVTGLGLALMGALGAWVLIP